MLPFNLFLGFYEERAILLGNMGRHLQALAIYVCLFKDNSMAEEYVYSNKIPYTKIQSFRTATDF